LNVIRSKRNASFILVAISSCVAIASTDSGQTGSPALTQPQVESVVEEVSRDVERLRGLSFKRPVPVELIGDDAAATHVVERIESFDLTDRLEVSGQAYTMLGLLPPKMDVLSAYLGALREQAGGFYNPASGSYYLLDDLPLELLNAISAHELTHALEDQYYDLDAGMHAAIEDDDRLFALSAVSEGSAMLVMAAYLAQQLASGEMGLAQLQAAGEAQASQAEALNALPQVLLRQLLGPYSLGANFLSQGGAIAAASGEIPVGRIDAAYRDAPRSTEQILHPQKYWDPQQRDDPREVPSIDPVALLGSGWERRGHGVLGELILALVVEPENQPSADGLMLAAPSAWTHPAAAGWGGDRWELWQRGGRRVTLLSTVWDTSEDAAEFARALRSKTLSVDVARDRVVVVAGKLGKKKKSALLAALLAAEPVVSTPGSAVE